MTQDNNYKIIIHNNASELPNTTIIELTQEQWYALWRALEIPFQKALNADEIKKFYDIEMKPKPEI
jgi:hypothetical protein